MKKALGVIFALSGCILLKGGTALSQQSPANPRGLTALDFPDAPITAVLVIKEPWLEGNEAYVVRDEEKIAELARLFRNNRRGPPAPCGYHISLWFQNGQASNPNRAFCIKYNLECSVLDYELHAMTIDSLMHHYADLVMSKPSHFLINMKIDTKVSPESLRAALQEGEDLLFFRDATRLHSYIDVDMTAFGDDSCNARIDTAWQRLGGTEVAHGDVLSSRTEDCRVRFYFPFGTDIAEILAKLGEVNADYTFVPDYYTVWLLSREPYSAGFRQRLLDEHEFILDLNDDVWNDW